MRLNFFSGVFKFLERLWRGEGGFKALCEKGIKFLFFVLGWGGFVSFEL